ncbi:MAG: UXX-star (seleno)protein family 1 [Pseudomonadota bacterium]
MEKKVVIYGKNNCPFTKAAREAYTRKKIDFQYIDVLQNPAELDRMLELSKGERKVPVIVDNYQVIIGYDGKG